MTAIKRLMLVAAALVVWGCSFDVVNPGPVEDGSLNDPGAYSAVVRGVQYNLSRAIGIDAFYSGVAAKEYSTAGRVNATKLPLIFGQLDVNDMSANTWNWSQAARWQAEDGQRRLRTALGATAFASNKFAGQLLMYGALANRVLGENFCEAVIDGGARQPNTEYFNRAEAQATEAIAVANAAGDTPTRQAAYAIRASARLSLGKFALAGADAAVANVPTAFSLSAPFDQGTTNLIVSTNDYAVGGSFRAISVWRSYFESYFRTYGDLRVWWDSSALASGKARDGEFTGIPWYYPRKYIPTRTTDDLGTPIRLVSGREARLIEAEVALRNSNIPGMLTILNALHTGVAVRAGAPGPPTWTATTTQQAWDVLRHERSIELWIEARTMWDLRRWIADGSYANFTITPNGPGVMGSPDDVADRIRLCFPIARGERNTNPNLPLDPTNDDPKSPIFNNTIAPW